MGEHRLLRLMPEQLEAPGREIGGPRAEVDVEQAVRSAPRQLQPALLGLAHLGRDPLALQLGAGPHRQEIHETEQVLLAIAGPVVEDGEDADGLMVRVQDARADVALDSQLAKEHGSRGSARARLRRSGRCAAAARPSRASPPDRTRSWGPPCHRTTLRRSRCGPEDCPRAVRSARGERRGTRPHVGRGTGRTRPAGSRRLSSTIRRRLVRPCGLPAVAGAVMR